MTYQQRCIVFFNRDINRIQTETVYMLCLIRYIMLNITDINYLDLNLNI